MTLHPRTTRTFTLESLGYEGLRPRVRPLPPARADQVLIRLRAASLNYRDLKIIKGLYAKPPALPVVPLSDGAGEVIEIGPEVERRKIGDRVMPIYMEGWYSGPKTAAREGWRSRGGDLDGIATEYALVRERDVVPLADSMSCEEAACLPCAAVTAWHALVCVGEVKSGDTVLVLGSGGVSLFALQFAKIHGARVIATSGDDDKLRRLIALGASDGINYRRAPDWAEKVRDLTDGRGVDQVIEVGGAGTMRQSVRAVRDGGQVQVVGDLTGGFGSGTLAERDIRITAITVGSRAMTEDVVRTIDAHGEKPVIDSRFPFADLERAFRHLESGRHFGKIVIVF